VPTDNEDGEFAGSVEFDMMRGMEKQLGHIAVIRLPAEKLYRAYLNERVAPEMFSFLRMALTKLTDCN
jgi:hypothetical protein